jgi:hypothetical protein
MEPIMRRETVELAPADRDDALHVCASCDSSLVQPEWWEETTGGAWRVQLRCPNCELRREGVYPQGIVDAFDEQLNEGSDELTVLYRRLVRDNLVAEMDRFAGALRAGAILPEDF